MRVYVSLPKPSFLRNLEPVVRLLSQRGHFIILGFSGVQDRVSYFESVVGTFDPDCLAVVEPPRRLDRFSNVADWLRLTIDYLFFLSPEFQKFPYSRLRRAGEIPLIARRLIRRHRLRYGWRRRAAIAWLRLVEEAIPPDPKLIEHFLQCKPDLLLVSPLLGIDSDQLEHIRAAKALRIPTLYAVHSWDNLSSKGLIRMRPEGIAVWNEIQRREAVDLHRQMRHRVWVTGAYNFDDWFAARPSMDRTAFLQHAGLPPDRAVILYLCSALYFPKIQREEDFFVEWLAALRQCSDPRLRDAAILVRPHPKRLEEFTDIDILGGDPGVAIWPHQGELPAGDTRKQTFFDSLFHADAVVALNTTAMIDAAIVGRPVHTILDVRYRLSQESTFHFPYLTDPATGILEVAKDWATHLRQLAAALSSGPDTTRARRFVESFARPQGVDHASAPRLADLIGKLASTRKIVPLRGAWLRPIALKWLYHMERRAKHVEKDAKRERAQKVGDWQKRQIFLEGLRSGARAQGKV